MSSHVGLLHPLSTANIGQRLRDAGENGAHRLDTTPTHRHSVEQLLRKHLLADGVLGVDDRRLSCDCHCLLQAADLQFGIHRRREICWQLDFLPLEYGESRQSEGYRVDTGTQVENLILTLLVGSRRAFSFDKRRTGCFDSHPRQDCPCAVLDCSCETTLCKHNAWRQSQECDCDEA